jgi:hypothetical protein
MDVVFLGNVLTCFWGDEPELHVSLADSQERWLDDRGTIEGFRTQWRPFLDASHRLLTRFPALLRKQLSPPHRAERFRCLSGGAIHSSTLSDREREKKRTKVENVEGDSGEHGQNLENIAGNVANGDQESAPREVKGRVDSLGTQMADLKEIIGGAGGSSSTAR